MNNKPRRFMGIFGASAQSDRNLDHKTASCVISTPIKEFGPRLFSHPEGEETLDVTAYDDDDEYSEAPSTVSSSSSSYSHSPPSSPGRTWKEFGPRLSQVNEGLPTTNIDQLQDLTQDVYIVEALERKRLRGNRRHSVSSSSSSNRFRKRLSLQAPWRNNTTRNVLKRNDEYQEEKEEFLSRRFDSSIMLTL